MLLDADAEAVGMKQAQTRLLLTVERYLRGDALERHPDPERLRRAVQAVAQFLFPDSGKARATGPGGRSSAARSLTPQTIEHGMAVLLPAVMSSTDCQLRSLRILTELTKVCLYAKLLRSPQAAARELLPFWSQLLPSTATSAAETSSSFFALVHSGVPTDVRCAVCALLEHIFCDAQGYWAMAQERYVFLQLELPTYSAVSVRWLLLRTRSALPGCCSAHVKSLSRFSAKYPKASPMMTPQCTLPCSVYVLLFFLPRYSPAAACADICVQHASCLVTAAASKRTASAPKPMCRRHFTATERSRACICVSRRRAHRGTHAPAADR